MSGFPWVPSGGCKFSPGTHSLASRNHSNPASFAQLQRELGLLSAPSPAPYWFRTCTGRPVWGSSGLLGDFLD